MIDDFATFATELDRMPAKLVSQGRGMTAKKVDAAAADARSAALSTWTRYGRGAQGSAGTIRARMSRNQGEIVGYVFADGEGAYQSEHGSGPRAPQPVIAQAVEKQTAGWAEELGKIAGDL